MAIFASFELVKSIDGYSHAFVQRVNLKAIDNFKGDFVDSFIRSQVLLGKSEEDEAPVKITEQQIDQLMYADISTLSDISGVVMGVGLSEDDMSELGSDVEGDGYDKAIFLPLRHPILIKTSEREVSITALEFQAKTYGAIKGLFSGKDGGGFRDQIRQFAVPVGVELPLADHVLDRLDAVDVVRIKDFALGKLEKAGTKNWKKR